MLKAATALFALALVSTAADARSLTWARTGDALTLDPHAQNEGGTHNMLHQLYEPLILRDYSGKIHPTLSVSWKITDDHASVPFYMDGSFKAAVDLKPQ